MAETAVKEEVKPEAPKGPLIVDCRTEEEFAYGAIPGAINVPLDDMEYQLDQFGAKDRQIIFYCASGARSAYAVQILREYGYTNLENGGGITRMMYRVRNMG